MQNTQNKIWNATLYLRLSRDDGDKEESNSITGQRELLRDYISQRPEFREYAVRVDDGFSGSTFERPSFQKMIEDVKAGRTDCIIVKDLTDKMERLEKSSQTSTEQGGAFIEKYKEYTELETLTAEIANDVVKRVTVYKDGGIEIELALRDELEKLLTCLETVDAAS